MILIVPVIVGVATVALSGGKISALLDVRFRNGWMLMAALATQILIMRVVPGATTWHQMAHLASYGLAGGFVYANRSLPHFLTLAAGGAMNLTAIAANGGTMPARAAAVVSAGLQHVAGEFHNSATVADAKLAFLGDVFAIPQSWPLSNTFSAGDVVLVAAAILLVNHVCKAADRRPARIAGRAAFVAA